MLIFFQILVDDELYDEIVPAVGLPIPISRYIELENRLFIGPAVQNIINAGVLGLGW